MSGRVAGGEAHHRRVGVGRVALGTGRLRQLSVAEDDDGRIALRLLRQRLERRAELGLARAELVLDAPERVQHEQPAGAGAAEAGEPLDVGPQQRVDLGQRSRQHRRHLARERLAGAERVAVADQDEIGERAQLAGGGQRIAPGPSGRGVQLLGREIEDREVERFVGEAGEPLGHGIDLEHEAFAAAARVAMRGRSVPSPSATRKRSCPPRAAFRSTSTGREPSASAIERGNCTKSRPRRCADCVRRLTRYAVAPSGMQSALGRVKMSLG